MQDKAEEFTKQFDRLFFGVGTGEVLKKDLTDHLGKRKSREYTIVDLDKLHELHTFVKEFAEALQSRL